MSIPAAAGHIMLGSPLIAIRTVYPVTDMPKTYGDESKLEYFTNLHHERNRHRERTVPIKLFTSRYGPNPPIIASTKASQRYFFHVSSEPVFVIVATAIMGQ